MFLGKQAISARATKSHLLKPLVNDQRPTSKSEDASDSATGDSRLRLAGLNRLLWCADAHCSLAAYAKRHGLVGGYDDLASRMNNLSTREKTTGSFPKPTWNIANPPPPSDTGSDSEDPYNSHADDVDAEDHDLAPRPETSDASTQTSTPTTDTASPRSPLELPASLPQATTPAETSNPGEERHSTGDPGIARQETDDPYVKVIDNHNIDPAKVHLPRLTLVKNFAAAMVSVPGGFTLPLTVNLLALTLSTATYESIKYLLGKYTKDEISRIVAQQSVDNEWPLIFFAVQRNDPRILNLLLQYGEKGLLARSCSTTGRIPVLAYATLLGHQTCINTLDVVKLLLASGADPMCVPQELWVEYMKRPNPAARNSTKMANPSGAWCTEAMRNALAEALTLSRRYVLWKASKQPRPSARSVQVDELLNISALRELPYWLVGQDVASRLALACVFSHMVRAHESKLPLTAIFAGPSGHGKTELAERMAKLLNLEFCMLDCGQIQNAFSLLGSDLGYVGSTTGSRLNNFLMTNNGKKSIVFLDELDKTNMTVWNALLVLLGSGQYHDKRNNSVIDCSQTIFIMATNQGDDIIEDHYKNYMQSGDDGQTVQAHLPKLMSALRKDFITKFGAPLTGRFRAIVPFFPFNTGEAAVVAHSFMLELGDSMRKDIDMKKPHLIGHAHLEVNHDEDVCLYIAESSYMPKLGARILKSAVDQQIMFPLDVEWRMNEIEITEEMNHEPLTKWTVEMVENQGVQTLNIFQNGVSRIEA